MSRSARLATNASTYSGLSFGARNTRAMSTGSDTIRRSATSVRIKSRDKTPNVPKMLAAAITPGTLLFAEHRQLRTAGQVPMGTRARHREPHPGARD